MNTENADYPSPLKVGDRAEVIGILCLRNSAGGTEVIQNANMECTVTKAFWDSENGWRFWGTPVQAADLAVLRERGTSEFSPDWYRRNRPDDAVGLAHVETALAAFDPSKVFFSEHDIARPGVLPRR